MMQRVNSFVNDIASCKSLNPNACFKSTQSERKEWPDRSDKSYWPKLCDPSRVLVVKISRVLVGQIISG
jgi:hypothetical protein